MTKYCGDCGNEALPEDIFCTACGSRLGERTTHDTESKYNKKSENKQSRNKVGFNQAITMAYKKCFDFKTRSSKAEYWYFVLFQIVITTFVVFITTVYDSQVSNGYEVSTLADVLFGAVLVFAGIFYFLTIIPALALTTRRLHDTGRSAAMLLIYLIPYLGPLILVFGFLTQNGDTHENKYGVVPNGI
ncbi:DUF805 domain-containing protein [Candidatus Saccharibacteria bacterium]|nr:DUF805 domain-containing protein [Candidatus Saccharibacteria bacterium]